jgi:hypothetical protein
MALALGLLSVAPAWAQTKEQKAGARAAAEAGGDAFDAGKYAEAADLFERAERLMHAPPHLLYAARSHVKLGHLVEARELYLTLTRDHLPDSAPRAFRDAQQIGEKELADVESRIAYVSVVVQGAGAGASSVRVTRNNEAVPAELLGIPTPVNPGGYTYQAFADGMESTTTTVKLADGAKETVVLTLRGIPGAKKTPAKSGTSGTASPGSLSEPPPSDAAPGTGESRPLLIGSIVSFGVGAVGVGLGTFFYIKSNETHSRAEGLNTQCLLDNCPPDSEQARGVLSVDNEAATQQGIAIGSFIGGGIGIAAGITLLVLDSGRSRAESARAVVPIVGPNYLGVAGRF